MLKRLIAVLLTLAILLMCFAGCKKNASPADAGEVWVDSDGIGFGYFWYDGIELAHGNSAEVYISLQKQIASTIHQQDQALSIQEIYYYIIPCELFEKDEKTFESFMGFQKADLAAMFPCTSLIFEDSGPMVAETIKTPNNEAALIPTTSTEFDFLSFLQRVGLGCCVILIGATISVATGGTFTCAMMSIAREAMVEGLISGGVASISAAVNNANNEQKNIATAFLDGFSIGFLSGSISGAVCSILWHPSCFIKDTPVATPEGNMPIQSINVGDYVLSQNIYTNTVESKRVLNTFVNETYELIYITTANGERITCTPSHPFYVPSIGWRSANQLRTGDCLIKASGETETVCHVERTQLQNPILVYNLEVEGNHNYYVGDGEILVHNTCEVGQFDSYGNLSNQAVKGDGIEAHHVPSKQFMQQFGVSERDALAINIKHSTHAQTFTYGFSVEKNKWYLSLSPGAALEVDLSNLRAICAKEGTLDSMLPILQSYKDECYKRFPHLFN